MKRADAPIKRPSPLRRSLRASTIDGTAHASMLGLGESYLPAFALILGATPFGVGLITTLPLLAGALFQLLTPYGAAWLGNKRWVVLSAFIQALTFVPMAASVFFDDYGYEWLLFWSCVYWAMALGINPAWNAWMGQLVPARLRSSFFSKRNIPVQIALLVTLVTGGLLLEAAQQGESTTRAGFVLLFALAAASRLLSSGFLAQQHEPPTKPPRIVNTLPLLQRLRSEPIGRVMLLILSIHASVHVAAPYFTPYMLDELSLSYAEFTMLNGTVIVARILSSAYWGAIAQAYGNRRAFQVSAALIVPLSGLWAFSSNFYYLLVLQMLAGFAWAGFELMVMLSFLDTTDEQTRARVLSIFNLLNGIAIVGGSIVGGLLLEWTGSQGYVYVFLVSATLRAFSVVTFARGAGLRRKTEHDFDDVLFRVISFRAGHGPELRPVIVSSTESEPTKSTEDESRQK